MISEKILTDYLKGICSDAQAKEVEEWILCHEDSQAVNEFLNKAWNEAKHQPLGLSFEEKRLLLSELRSQIGINTLQSNRKSFVKSLGRFAQRAAAILFLPLIVASVILYTKVDLSDNTPQLIATYAPVGQQAKVMLPDGTEVVLNSDSHLEYSSDFGDGTRDVILSGEAHFHVQKGEIPFIVNTSHLNVKVLGTVFNVSAYEEDEFVSTTLEEGKILLENEELKLSKILKPGFRARLNLTENKLSIREVDVKKYSAWKEGKLVFVNEPLSKIKEKLERKFDVEIILSEELLKEDYRYTAEFKNETITEILAALNFINPIRYKVEGNKLFISKSKKRIK
ncbi:FecR family protein [Marinilabiliaceae bacterium JC017]|nr:FecR family protein [Marinilabiliaceae bacterium JC017]